MSDPTKPLRPAIVWLMAVATGIIVASNYYAQPLLHTIAQDLGLSVSSAGLVVTAAQVSYGVGLLFLVPLGDMLEKRNLIFAMTLIAAGGLLASAMAPNLAVLLAGTVATGLLSVVAQILVPFGATLAAPHERGKVVGTLMSGLLLGILLARTVAGLFAASGSWRTVYWFAAVLMVALAFVLRRELPRHDSEHASLGYAKLLASIAELFAHEPVLRNRSLIGGLAFACFSLFWTSMAFMLASPPYGYSDTVIGMFGLAGAAGALAASRVGRLADRGHGDGAAWFSLLLLLVSWLPLLVARQSLIALVVGVIALDLAIQAVHIGNQNTVIKLRPEARNRINAGYMTSYFVGGALGSVLSAQVYERMGWTGIAVCGLGLSAIAIVLWIFRPTPASA